ncbi:hypothetical protein RYX36_033532 [Vicia faba]
MSATGYYIEPLLDKYKFFENLIFYIPGAVNRLPTWFPILYCYLAIVVVVKNRDFPVIFRFHVIAGMLLEIALQIIWVASNFLPLIHFKGSLESKEKFCYLVHVLQTTLKVVMDYAKDRPIIFSTFQPDAAILVRKLQRTYPVFFLTNGGCELYEDLRRNSLEEALKLSLENGLEGIVSEIKGIFRNPGAVNKIKEANLSLLTYGKLNNVPQAVRNPSAKIYSAISSTINF